MKNYFFTFFLISMTFVLSCQKEGPDGPPGKDGAADLQIRFELGNNISNGGQDTTIWTIENGGIGIHQFNIKNYVGADSAVFVIYSTRTAEGCCDAPDVLGEFKIELYDLTNHLPIVNSRIITDDIEIGSYLSSGNILSNFPDETIDIGVRVIFDKNLYASAGRSYLFIYR